MNVAEHMKNPKSHLTPPLWKESRGANNVFDDGSFSYSYLYCVGDKSFSNHFDVFNSGSILNVFESQSTVTVVPSAKVVRSLR